MRYDKRMNPLDNWRFLYWRPLVCRIRGCRFTCFKLVPTTPQLWFYWCGRCMEMTDDKSEPCGGCTNGCGDVSD